MDCGSGLTGWRRLPGALWAWQAAGVGERACLDSASFPAPKGARKPGRLRGNTPRVPGTKRQLAGDRPGTPLALCLTGANRHDRTVFADLLAAIPPLRRPRRRPRKRPANRHADKAAAIRRGPAASSGSRGTASLGGGAHAGVVEAAPAPHDPLRTAAGHPRGLRRLGLLAPLLQGAQPVLFGALSLHRLGPPPCPVRQFAGAAHWH